MSEVFKGRLAILGMGYIGLPTAVVIATRGVDVIGVDINPARAFMPGPVSDAIPGGSIATSTKVRSLADD